jgi:hypothetical protein
MLIQGETAVVRREHMRGHFIERPHMRLSSLKQASSRVSDEFGPFASRRPFRLGRAFRSVVVVIGLTEGGDFGDGVWKFDDEAQFAAHRFDVAAEG